MSRICFSLACYSAHEQPVWAGPNCAGVSLATTSLRLRKEGVRCLCAMNRECFPSYLCFYYIFFIIHFFTTVQI